MFIGHALYIPITERAAGYICLLVAPSMLQYAAVFLGRPKAAISMKSSISDADKLVKVFYAFAMQVLIKVYIFPTKEPQ